jgi:hypothetical protein
MKVLGIVWQLIQGTKVEIMWKSHAVQQQERMREFWCILEIRTYPFHILFPRRLYYRNNRAYNISVDEVSEDNQVRVGEDYGLIGLVTCDLTRLCHRRQWLHNGHVKFPFCSAGK